MAFPAGSELITTTEITMPRVSNRFPRGQDKDPFWEALYTVAYDQAQSLIDYCGSSFTSDDERTLFGMALALRRLGEEFESTTMVLREVNRGVKSSILDEEDILRIVRSAYSDDSPEWQHLKIIRQSPEYAQARDRYQRVTRYRLH